MNESSTLNTELEKKITVIIPTWNMAPYLKPLFDSIVNSKLAHYVTEIIFVCDKSTDGSEMIIQRIAELQKGKLPSVRLLQPEERRGLFVARYLGAKAAQTPKLLFIDSRITLPKITGDSLPELAQSYPAMSANVDIDIKKNTYCLYWQRSHEVLFRKTFQENSGIITVSAANYGQYRIGGTCFYCSRDLFVTVSEQFLKNPLHSDDTFVMEEMAKSEPFTVHPKFRIQWEPRNNAKSFLKHLYQRGPGFAEYHIFTRRSWLTYAVLIGGVFVLLFPLLLITKPTLALSILGFCIFGTATSTLLFTRSPSEFVRLAPLHVGVVLCYGFGALRGIWVIWKKRRGLKSK